MSTTFRALNPADGDLKMASRLSRFKVMSLTDAAAARVKEIIANTEKPIAGPQGRREERRLRRHVLHDGIRRKRRPRSTKSSRTRASRC